MKALYLKTLAKLAELPAIKYTDRDRGQIDRYDTRPAIAFPCALISISQPRRKNLTSRTQQVQAQITIRLAFERLQDASSISSESRRLKALEYYDMVEAVENLLQGYGDTQMNRWECTSITDEQRPDLDIVRFVFVTGFVRNLD
jgi:hypothetical protein